MLISFDPDQSHICLPVSYFQARLESVVLSLWQKIMLVLLVVASIGAAMIGVPSIAHHQVAEVAAANGSLDALAQVERDRCGEPGGCCADMSCASCTFALSDAVSYPIVAGTSDLYLPGIEAPKQGRVVLPERSPPRFA